MKKRPSYYEILRVSPQASDMEVKRAYHNLAKKFHPDNNRDNPQLAALRFRLVSDAYANIKTREKRIAYNNAISPKPQNDNTKSSGFFSHISELLWPQKGTRS